MKRIRQEDVMKAGAEVQVVKEMIMKIEIMTDIIVQNRAEAHVDKNYFLRQRF